MPPKATATKATAKKAKPDPIVSVGRRGVHSRIVNCFCCICGGKSAKGVIEDSPAGTVIPALSENAMQPAPSRLVSGRDAAWNSRFEKAVEQLVQIATEPETNETTETAETTETTQS